MAYFNPPVSPEYNNFVAAYENYIISHPGSFPSLTNDVLYNDSIIGQIPLEIWRLLPISRLVKFDFYHINRLNNEDLMVLFRADPTLIDHESADFLFYRDFAPADMAIILARLDVTNHESANNLRIDLGQQPTAPISSGIQKRIGTGGTPQPGNNNNGGTVSIDPRVGNPDSGVDIVIGGPGKPSSGGITNDKFVWGGVILLAAFWLTGFKRDESLRFIPSSTASRRNPYKRNYKHHHKGFNLFGLLKK